MLSLWSSHHWRKPPGQERSLSPLQGHLLQVRDEHMDALPPPQETLLPTTSQNPAFSPLFEA